MARPKSGYFLEDGTKVPSVTTIISRFDDKESLIWWAVKLKNQGLDPLKVRNDSAKAGTLMHAMIEAHVAGDDPSPLMTDMPGNIVTEALQAYHNYLKFVEEEGIKAISLEEPLLSEVYGFGGTPDAMFEIDGQLCMADWKSSPRAYKSHLYQLAAYGILWDENHPDTPLTGEFHLMCFPRTTEGYTHHIFDNLDSEREVFLSHLSVYQQDIDAEKRVKRNH